MFVLQETLSQNIYIMKLGERVSPPRGNVTASWQSICHNKIKSVQKKESVVIFVCVIHLRLNFSFTYCSKNFTCDIRRNDLFPLSADFLKSFFWGDRSIMKTQCPLPWIYTGHDCITKSHLFFVLTPLHSEKPNNELVGYIRNVCRIPKPRGRKVGKRWICPVYLAHSERKPWILLMN